MTDLTQLIDVVRQHGEVAYAFIFAYAASHAMLMALFAGYAAQLGVLDLKLTIIHCFAGSFVGDVVRFWIARRYGDGLLARWPRISAHAVTVKRLVDRHALWLPLIHRFPYGIRGLGRVRLRAVENVVGAVPGPECDRVSDLGGVDGAGRLCLRHGVRQGARRHRVRLSIASLVVFLAISWLLSRKLEQAIEADARRNPVTAPRGTAKGRPARDGLLIVATTMSAQAAEQPDHQNDRQRNADHPQQKSTSHSSLHAFCFVAV